MYLFFNETRPLYLPEHTKIANFDCRIYQTPTLNDACAQLLWRENDATKNSIQMLGHAHYSDKQLFGLHTSEIQDKLMIDKGVNWNNLETKYKRGSYVKRIKTSKPFSADELFKLPPMHQAHKNPNLVIERSIYSVVEYPIFTKITNKEDVIFRDKEPILRTEEV